MRIIYFSQFYMPEPIAPSFRATDNSRIWTAQGHEVTVFTGYPNYPKGKVYDGYTVQLLLEEKIEGVRILRNKLIAVPNTSILKRLQNALSFFFYGLINIIVNQKKIGNDYDVVIGTSGLIFTALLGWIFSALHHIPFVFEIRDITYMQMQAIGKKKNSFVVKIMKKLELYLCKKAKRVVVVTNGFKKILIQDGIKKEKIEVITNGADIIRKKNTDSNPKLILSYFGTLGLSQNIQETFEYAKQISFQENNFEYLIIGEGAQKQEIAKDLSRGNYPFVNMLPGMSSDELEKYYDKTEWSIIALRRTESFKYTIPSKLFQIMGRGIAILFIGPEGETSEIINRFNTGITLTDTYEKNINKLTAFFEKENWREVLKKMGKNGQTAVENNYLRKKLALKYLALLETAIK